MTDKERAVVMAFTGVAMLTGDKFTIFHKYIEDILKRPVWTHELADPDHQLIALDRYIHRLKWNDIAEVEHLGRATVFRIHGRMLEKMVKILQAGRFE